MKDNLRKDYIKKLLILFLILLISIAVFTTIGTANVSILDTIKIILHRFPLIGHKVDISNISKSYDNIIWSIRFPRVILGVLVGSSLSIAGATFQGMFKNPMADPFVIGISSGAALGASIAIILKANLSFMNFGLSIITLFAFLGALLSVGIVYNIARVNGKVPITTLLLSGVAVGQFFTAIMSFLMVIFDNDMKKIIYWTMGSFSGKGWEPVIKLSLPLILASVGIIFFAEDLNIMLMGESAAHSTGIDVEKTKRYLIVLSSFITALVVSVSGIIGFVGLIIPHVVRMMFGPDHKFLIPASGIIGAIFMIFSDTIARTIISPTEVPVGIITALFGGPFFIYILKTRKKEI